ncbi:MAG: ornithine carbamoyltransferase, partial [Anaerotignum sp.]|nr:ornithine carbamoyltransferase [Anaerotignum sp.]
AFAGYQVNKELMAVANKDAMVLHCLPAYREQEITTVVFEEHADEIFDEAENRLHAQKAILVKLMG